MASHPLLNSGYDRPSGGGRVLRALGPKGARVDRVLVQKKPQRAEIEVREDQLEVLTEASSS
jgi:hypothetical protein